LVYPYQQPSPFINRGRRVFHALHGGAASPVFFIRNYPRSISNAAGIFLLKELRLYQKYDYNFLHVPAEPALKFFGPGGA
jgi:hypothetical protein